MLFSDPRQAPAQSIACERRDYPEWHRGRPRYAVWTVPVDCPRVLARLQRAQQHLGAWLHVGYRRQAHITLFVCGFPAEQPHFDDDFPGERLAAQLTALDTLDANRFELQIGGLDSYASAPFLTVADPQGRLAQLRTALATHSTEIRQAPYHPHLTVGLYARTLPRQTLRQRLGEFSDSAPLTLTVRELHYSTYAAAELFGTLRCERRVVLSATIP
ncbi:2'-5' RNA ligase family protein [Pseudomonas oryzae]|uniref:2'-5' RNA ligase superfamily protein n=1 Tax=Pseudomonas oryzae TaxID=1392877 RepID=A0A1H1R767_9PSED|nr:2'-5' RNA ligase family protein [Pseudomonas oryzae]SDS31634.1 2'-5' RNA ligase superfamily protein [Pseudomonas oryzae]